MTDLIGKTISHYIILDKLGEGGIGIVYKAKDIKLKRSVALKFLPPECMQNKKDKTQLILEARAAAAINHPNICTIHDINEYNGQHFIVMELMEGETLREIMDRRGSLPESEVIDIAIKICEALRPVHEKGIAHRDIKPENILVRKDGEVKLSDFGLARDTSDNKKLTVTGQVLGTPAYMSPEQGIGDPTEVIKS